MAPPNLSQHTSCEADIHLAISALNTNRIQTERRAAATFEVSRATLHRRRAGRPARSDCQPNSKEHTQQEEEVIVKYVLSLNTRGFSPTYNAVRSMANLLLLKRGGCPVGRDWPRNFVERTDSLTTRFD
jgi:hypothetical protein